MVNKILFEIPIYAMSEKAFSRRWEKKKEEMSEGRDEKVKSDIMQSLYPSCVWKYNQIIGFIVISVTSQDVIFDVFRSMDKRFYFESKIKHFITNLFTNGTHFYASDKTEDEIKKGIKEMLKSIKKDHLKSRFYVDLSAFNNLLGFLNIKQIMKSL